MKPKAGSSSVRSRQLRLGIYGGTFDPVHHGHLLLARDALEQLRLDAVLFVPCGQSPLKTRKPRATDARRLAMLRLALKNDPRFWLTRCEIDRPAPSYSYDTALEIREAFPRAELFWLIGADQLATLDQWHRPDDLRRLVTFVFLPRGEPAGKNAPRAVLSLPQPRRVDISATEIRHRVKSRLPIDHLVPAPIAAYIKRHGLYLS
ncbi:MAG TPA: nicotinate-nucleotide adenylyltransferase [Candidatus Methylacidiphilales bacterium]|jgi:nicotinate-nucleotide adenylyltransferase|nr:nicotinate-nucleotide adenylyltransferase [Candidatus Methylacidiphilales bacterium]